MNPDYEEEYFDQQSYYEEVCNEEKFDVPFDSAPSSPISFFDEEYETVNTFMNHNEPVGYHFGANRNTNFIPLRNFITTYRKSFNPLVSIIAVRTKDHEEMICFSYSRKTQDGKTVFVVEHFLERGEKRCLAVFDCDPKNVKVPRLSPYELVSTKCGRNRVITEVYKSFKGNERMEHTINEDGTHSFNFVNSDWRQTASSFGKYSKTYNQNLLFVLKSIELEYKKSEHEDVQLLLKLQKKFSDAYRNFYFPNNGNKVVSID